MNNRRKGHNLERKISRDLQLFFPHCKTSRASSRLLDNCGIDLNFIPFLVQAKAGYKTNRPKYEEEYGNVKEQIRLNFPDDHIIHTLPFILIHKLDTTKKKSEESEQVTMSYSFFMRLLSLLAENNVKLPTLSV